MKYLILCEGNNEKVFISKLIQNHLLIYTWDDLLGGNVYHVRQISDNATIDTYLRQIGEDVTILRIGDTLKDELKIPPRGEQYKKIKFTVKYCTRPEFEMLLIISENLVKKYRKSRTKPKEFAKMNIKVNGEKYNCCEDMLSKYLDLNIEKIPFVLNEYKRIIKNKKMNIILLTYLNINYFFVV